MDARRQHGMVVRGLAGALLGLAGVSPARADDPPPPAPDAAPVPLTEPSRDPALSNPGVDRTLLDQSRSRLNTNPIDPVPLPRAQRLIPSVPPPAPLRADDPSAAPRAATVTAEGAVTGMMRGRLYRAGGEVIFAAMMRAAAGPDETPADERAFVLLPNQTLAQLSGATANMGEGVPVSLSGQAFSYRGAAYLLPLAFSIAQEPPPATGTEVAPDAANGASPAAAQPVESGQTGQTVTADPRVTDLVARLEQSRQPRALDPAMMAPTGAAAPAAPSTRPARGSEITPSQLGALAPEGTLIVRARARMLRPGWASGRLVVAFDNDPSSPSRAPMLMMPSRMLEQAEAMAGQLGEDATFLISGRVTIHEGRNYFLPMLVQRLPRGDVRPGQ